MKTKYWTPFVFGVVFLATTIPLPVAAQSLAVEGLQAMLDDIHNYHQRDEVIRLGGDLHQELTNEVDDLQRVRDNSPGYLLHDAQGRLGTVSRQGVADLAKTIATNFILANSRYGLIMGLLSRGEDGGDLDYATGRAVLGIIYQRPGSGKGAAHITQNIAEALTLLLEEADARNRQSLDQEIAQVFEDRAAVASMVQAAMAMQGGIVPDAPPAPEGFMNEAGFWLVQLSGSGWHKLGAGYATRIVGYANIVVQITDEVTEPKRTRWYWQLPIGYDIQVFERARQEEARERSRKNCANRPPHGPRNAAPEIWNDGPHYEVVQGPIATWNEAGNLRGNPRLPNKDPQGSQFWEHETGLRYKDLDPTCESYGVSLVD